MNISARLVDCTHGVPAAGVGARLDLLVGGDWHAGPTTQSDRAGRLDSLFLQPPGRPQPDRYRLVVDIGRYFAHVGVITCYPEIVVVFVVPDPSRRHDIAVSASAYGYSTQWTNE
jgi:5-hydroxyisourate hydrolase